MDNSIQLSCIECAGPKLKGKHTSERTHTTTNMTIHIEARAPYQYKDTYV